MTWSELWGCISSSARSRTPRRAGGHGRDSPLAGPARQAPLTQTLKGAAGEQLYGGILCPRTP
ncbi:hypothetical protein [Streptomyces sp. NRRL S-118]|uniref:hypothetical protein n=1 Tax=Streptomyces sp. NRRL S-118 TaxID=1463881 RepID=UPI000A89ECF9|nr:hypothetical protein [Streptomyces sp. NRRL S-118]